MATLLPEVPSDDDNLVDEDESADEMDGTFEFGGILGEDGIPVVPSQGWSYQTALNKIQQENESNKPSNAPRIDVSALIAAKRETLQGDDNSSNSSRDDDSHSSRNSSSSKDDDDNDDQSNEHLEEDVVKTRTGNGDGEGDDDINSSDSDESAKAAAFFDHQMRKAQDIQVFNQLALSRPMLRGIAAMGFVTPTPIQASVIPLALSGRDICASAVTGSGKSAAFLLPVCERLLHRQTGSTKALILTPTRELAAQCLGMLTTLAQFTKLRACLIVGGTKNVSAQAAELRARPDIVVATPGRLLDHVTNSPGITLDYVEFLVLDEADRLLDLGFQDEVHEIVKQCPVQRQTLLFSATMNTKVDDLVRLSLKRPVRVRISDKEKSTDVEVAPRLEQEFVRVRAGNEGVNREALLVALLKRTFTKHVIVFFDTKASAHRLMIVCGLLGIKCAELHGNLTQQQRLQALEDFRNGDVEVLLATDLAARGLDIDRVKTVLNFEMPLQTETYIHRIGRTARAGRGGKSCTLIGEGRRHLMKELIKDAEGKGRRNGKTESVGVIRSRVVPPTVVALYVSKIQSLEPHIAEVLTAEAVARLDRLAEMEVNKAQNMIEHAEEIKSRPKREWFLSQQQKKNTKVSAADRKKLMEEKAGTGTHRMTRKKRRAREAMQSLNAHLDRQGEDGRPNCKPIDSKSAARKSKKKAEWREGEKANMSLRDMELEKAGKKRKRQGNDTPGDGSLFADEKLAFSKKLPKKEDDAATTRNFREYDHTMKLGKKKGVKSFKSKSKYKRRK